MLLIDIFSAKFQNVSQMVALVNFVQNENEKFSCFCSRSSLYDKIEK